MPTPTRRAYRPTFEEIDLHLITINQGYQREWSEGHSNAIVEHFDPRYVGPLLAARYPDGALEAADGMHRLHALLAMGITTWPCEIVEVPNEDAAADLFFARNVLTKTVRSYQQHRAALKANRPAAHAIEGALNGEGFTLVKSSHKGSASMRQANGLWYIGATSTAYKIAGASLLTREAPADELLGRLRWVAKVSSESFEPLSATLRKGWLSDRLMYGWAHLHATYDFDLDAEAIGEALRFAGITPLSIALSAGELSECGPNGTNNRQPWAEALATRIVSVCHKRGSCPLPVGWAEKQAA